jgi:hypothetical protein
MQISVERLPVFKNLPISETCRLIDFERIDVAVLDSMPPQIFVIVAGVKPYTNMTVNLVPRVYVQQAEYWEIEVVGHISETGIPLQAPYTSSIPLRGIMGTKGVEVIGATKSEKRDVPPTVAQQEFEKHKLFRRWLHSFEEDADDVKVYRPVGFAFPLARGRDGFDIKENGEFVRLDIAPTDGLKEVSGRWELNGFNKLFICYDDPTVRPDTLLIVALADDVLRIDTTRSTGSGTTGQQPKPCHQLTEDETEQSY